VGKPTQRQSYQHNALGLADPLITEHERYQALGANPTQRSDAYLQLFEQLNIATQDSQITTATMRGEVYGSEYFHSKISALISRTTKLSSHGGDRKSHDFHDQVG
jgi:putative transposase